MDIQPEFSRKIDVSRLPSEGRQETLTATPEECKALQKRFSVDAFHALEAQLQLQPWKRGGCRVRGSATARMTRTCVVTLEPFETMLTVKLDRLFAATPELRIDGKEIVIDVEDDDVGQIVDGEIEAGEFVVEELLLELDPHPRKPGAEFEPPSEGDAGETAKPERDNPFAVLKTLKRDD